MDQLLIIIFIFIIDINISFVFYFWNYKNPQYTKNPFICKKIKNYQNKNNMNIIKKEFIDKNIQ